MVAIQSPPELTDPSSSGKKKEARKKKTEQRIGSATSRYLS
jgi:hypothetical protein